MKDNLFQKTLIKYAQAKMERAQKLKCIVFKNKALFIKNRIKN